jgi:hypothetical protein
MDLVKISLINIAVIKVQFLLLLKQQIMPFLEYMPLNIIQNKTMKTKSKMIFPLFLISIVNQFINLINQKVNV